MNVLILKNIATEGPGTIEDYLRAKQVPYRVVDLSSGQTPPDLSGFSHLVVMGGPMAVYEMDRHPYLDHEARLIGKAIASGKHVLGVCLGAQLVAHALGAKVYPGGKKEVGWYQVSVSPEGLKDRCMSQLVRDGGQGADVFQWHGDTFDLPQGAVRLASSELFPNQAFRYSDRVYALQFHIEVTPHIVTDWLKNEEGIALAAVEADSARVFDGYRLRAGNFYDQFFRS